MYTDGEISNLRLAIMIFVSSFLLAPYSFGVMMYEKINYGLTNYFKLLGSWLGILVFAYAVLWVVGWLCKFIYKCLLPWREISDAFFDPSLKASDHKWIKMILDK